MTVKDDTAHALRNNIRKRKAQMGQRGLSLNRGRGIIADDDQVDTTSVSNMSDAMTNNPDTSNNKPKTRLEIDPLESE